MPTVTASAPQSALTNLKERSLATFKALWTSGTQNSAGRWGGNHNNVNSVADASNTVKLQVVNAQEEELEEVEVARESHAELWESSQYGIPVGGESLSQIRSNHFEPEPVSDDDNEDEDFDKVRGQLLSGGVQVQLPPEEDVRSSLSDVAILKKAYAESVLGLPSKDGIPPRYGKRVVKEFMGYYLAHISYDKLDEKDRPLAQQLLIARLITNL
ncbi:UNVERIFIED_CONTAM: hypothetical protein HDU68_012727 [Siphonaria sp. JEL0065]|nr:hypothetical protein HDU68_012727 [Siphonaria sp. JEL0065]